MFQNRTGKLALVDLYYEWGRGRNANLIHAQQGSTLYDIGAALSRYCEACFATLLLCDAGAKALFSACSRQHAVGHKVQHVLTPTFLLHCLLNS